MGEMLHWLYPLLADAAGLHGAQPQQGIPRVLEDTGACVQAPSPRSSGTLLLQLS